MFIINFELKLPKTKLHLNDDTLSPVFPFGEKITRILRFRSGKCEGAHLHIFSTGSKLRSKVVKKNVYFRSCRLLSQGCVGKLFLYFKEKVANSGIRSKEIVKLYFLLVP